MSPDELLEYFHEPARADAPAGRKPADAGLGSVRHAISDAFVGLYKDYFGKGPTRCRTYLEGDLVVVLLRGAATRAEQTLIDAGNWREVRESRHAWQEAMEDRFRAKIEELTGRAVDAFMSGSYHDPDITMEVFILGPAGDGRRGVTVEDRSV
jgi:uncharacterized protein YbcI